VNSGCVEDWKDGCFLAAEAGCAQREGQNI
jgi:hypothetical protein